MSTPDSKLETLSALADGELGRDELRFILPSAAADGALRRRWARWHVVRACLLRQPAALVDAGFADAVMARVAVEAGIIGTGRTLAALRRQNRVGQGARGRAPASAPAERA